MNLNITWLNLLILFGATQALIFAVVLLFNRKHPGAKFLSMFMLVLAYNGLETFNWSSGLERYYDFFQLFSFILIYAVGPSLYLYMSSLLHPEDKISFRRILLHYALPLFQLTYRMVIFGMYVVWRIDGTQFESAPMLMGIFWLYSEPLSCVVFLFYLVATLRLFRRARAQNAAPLSASDGPQIVTWAKTLLGSMCALGVAWPLTLLTPYVFSEVPYGSHYYPIELGLVCFTYWATLAGFYYTKVIYPKQGRGVPKAIAASVVRRGSEQLLHAMENDKLYLDPELSLAKLADHTGLAPKTISGILNQHFNQSFADFINGYRVREVQKKLLLPQNRHLTISGVALEAGFNSQATFQRVFKNITGASPRHYLASQVVKSDPGTDG